MKLRLSGPDLGRLRRAIVEAYVGAGANALATLGQALTDHLEGRTVFSMVTIQSTFDLQVGELLARANGEGWLPSLLGAIEADRPNATDLQDLLRTFLATTPARQVIDAAADATLAPRAQADLQDMLGGAILSFDALQARVRAVCRIDYADFSPPGKGTGFLVGPDLVLTNWHVAQRVIEASAAADQLRFRFDLLDRTAAITAQGRVARAKSGGASPILRWSPAAGVEVTGGHGEPGADKLDYALIRLEERVGDDPFGAGVRGFVGLTRTMPLPDPGKAVMVLQHPLRGELQFAIGKTLGLNATQSRLQHDAATQKGSSGSPVFDAALAPIALHNGTRPGTERSTQAYNTAAPLTLIVADLASVNIVEMIVE